MVRFADPVPTDHAGPEPVHTLAPMAWSGSAHPGACGLHGHALLHRSATCSIIATRCSPAHDHPGEEMALDAPSIAFTRSGLFEFTGSAGSTLADPTRILLSNAHEPFRTRHPGCVGDQTLVITPSPAVLADALASLGRPVNDPRRPFGHLSAPCSPRAFLAHQRLYRALAPNAHHDPHQTTDDIGIEETALTLVQEALSAAGPRPKARRDSTRRAHAQVCTELQSILAREYAQRHTLQGLADRVHTAPFHLCRIFRAHTGLSIHDYLARLRLHAAVAAIAADHAQGDLESVALATGFASHSHMCDTFRRTLDVAPSALRPRRTPSRIIPAIHSPA